MKFAYCAKYSEILRFLLVCKKVPSGLLYHFSISFLQSKGSSKVSSSITLGGKPQSAIQGSKIAQHSHSMSNLRKASISGPTVPLNAPIGGSSSNFYVPKNEYG